MVWRVLLRYLSNNEQLVHKLSESYPVRQTAKFLVSVFYRGKAMAENQDINADRLRELLRKLSAEVQSSIKNAEFKDKFRKP